MKPVTGLKKGVMYSVNKVNDFGSKVLDRYYGAEIRQWMIRENKAKVVKVRTGFPPKGTRPGLCSWNTIKGGTIFKIEHLQH